MLFILHYMVEKIIFNGNIPTPERYKRPNHAIEAIVDFFVAPFQKNSSSYLQEREHVREWREDRSRNYALIHSDMVLAQPFSYYPYSVGSYHYVTEENQEIISNINGFREIENLTDILISMAAVMQRAVQDEVGINPYQDFFIQLTDPVEPDYSGNGRLVVSCRGRESNPRFSNEFLDYYMGMQYPLEIRDSQELQDRLCSFESYLISEGIRTYPDSASVFHDVRPRAFFEAGVRIDEIPLPPVHVKEVRIAPDDAPPGTITHVYAFGRSSK
jgi:hypothetical protein